MRTWLAREEGQILRMKHSTKQQSSCANTRLYEEVSTYAWERILNCAWPNKESWSHLPTYWCKTAGCVLSLVRTRRKGKDHQECKASQAWTRFIEELWLKAKDSTKRWDPELRFQATVKRAWLIPNTKCFLCVRHYVFFPFAFMSLFAMTMNLVG